MDTKIPHRTNGKRLANTVIPEPSFVLQTTKGFSRRRGVSDVYKEQEREKYFSKFTADLKEKENEKITREYETQMRHLSEQASELEKNIAEYEEKVSTLGEVATTLEESINSNKQEEIKLMKNIKDKQSEIIAVKKDLLQKEQLLEEYLTYHTFLDTLYQESGIEVRSLDSLIMVYAALEDHCITIMQKNQEIKKELKSVIESGAESTAQSDARLKQFQKPVNNLKSAVEKMKTKSEKRELDIRKLETRDIITDTSMKKLVSQINLSYKKCINSSAIQVSPEMMLSEIEHSLYNLLDAMSTFPQEKLQSAAKARRKEELRREQEMKLEKLKKR